MNNLYYNTLFLNESYKKDKLVFHVSKDLNLNGKTFKPRIPKYLKNEKLRNMMLSNNLYEDWKIPRVCFGENINGCLRAICLNELYHYPIYWDYIPWEIEKITSKIFQYPEILNVYIPELGIWNYKHKENSDIVKEKLVYDAKVTKECWILEPVKLKYYGKIKVIGEKKKYFLNKKKKEKIYFDYEYEWLDKSNYKQINN